MYGWLYICHIILVVGVGSFMSFVVIRVGVLGMSVLYACWIC